MKQEISAGIIIYRKTKQGPKFLLLYHGGSYWNFAKGKVEREEQSMQTAFREVREEAGFTRNELRLVGHFREYEKFIFTKNKEKIFKIVTLYLAETRKTFVRISHEHDGYGWFTPNEAKIILKNYPNNLQVLKRAYEFLQHQGLENRTIHPKRQNTNL